MSRHRKKYDIINPIDREDWRESMSQIVYAVVPKNFYNNLLELKKNNLNWKSETYIENGIFGEGAYFFIDNIDYAKNCANKSNRVVIKAEIEVKNALNLLASTVGQKQISALMKNSAVTKLQQDKNIFDILNEKSNKKYDSIIGIKVEPETVIIPNNLVYGYMSRIICVKDYSCIKGYIEEISNTKKKKCNNSTNKINRRTT